MIKSVCVIYTPGHCGLFWTFLLSLSPESVPYYTTDLHHATDEQIQVVQNLSPAQRKQIVQYKTNHDFIRLHALDQLFQPDFFYANKAINDFFSVSVLNNHFNDYDFGTRYQYLHHVICVNLDTDRYQPMLDRAIKQYPWRPDPQPIEHIKRVTNDPRTWNLNMTKVLDSQQGFLDQYMECCQQINITPVIDTAIDYYTE